MANEEIQRGIEFLVQQQAQYTARLEKDEVRLAELQEYFKTLVELARGADERLDSHAARFESDEVRLAELEESFKMLVELARRADERLDSHAARIESDEVRLAELGEYFKMLVELARGADERQDNTGERVDRMAETVNALVEEMATLSHSMNELAQKAIADESRRASLEASFKVLTELAHRHG